MSPMEDLLRQTFAERERDVDGVPLLVPRPRRPRRAGVVLAGAAAAAAVLVGTTVALTGHRSAPADPETAASASGTALRFAPAPIISNGNRTSAFLTWAPTWTPAAETGREVTSTMQTRYYGREDGRFTAAVTVGRGDCRSLARMSGFKVALRRDKVIFLSGPHVATMCRPLPGGGALDVRIVGAADPGAEARRVAASIRTGRRDEVALPVSLPAGTVISRLSVGAVWNDTSRWTGNITTADGVDVYVGPPPPDGPLRPNRTLAGRPTVVNDDPWGGTLVQLNLSPTLRAHVFSDAHDRTVTIAAALHLGPIPDYSWLG